MERYIEFSNIQKRVNVSTILNSLEIEEDDVVYVGGSLVEGEISPVGKGMGNPYSDLDIFIVREHQKYICTKSVYSEETKKSIFVECDEVGYDIEVYDRKIIDEIMESLKNIEIYPDKRILNSLKIPEGWNFQAINGFLTRMKYGIGIYNDKIFEDIRKKMNISEFLLLYRYDILQKMDNIVEDIRGNIVQSEMETALILCRNLSLQLIDFILACEGEMNDRAKWAWIKFSNLVQIRPQYKRIYDQISKIQFENIQKNMKNEMEEYLSTVEEAIQDKLIEVSL